MSSKYIFTKLLIEVVINKNTPAENAIFLSNSLNVIEEKGLKRYTKNTDTYI